MNALTVCVEFHDFLAITLPRNLRYFAQFIVVTGTADWETQALTARYHDMDERVSWCASRAFYEDGCSFNRGRAIEENLDFALRGDGWCCLLDADVVLSPALVDHIPFLEPGNFYMANGRRECTDPTVFEHYADSPQLWDDLPIIGEKRLETHGIDGGAGYCQIFHASDPVLDSKPRYPVHWKHTGGSDTDFVAKWPPTRRKRLDFEVLHLGLADYHWHGRRGKFLNGKPVPKSEERARAMEQMYADRRKYNNYKREQVQLGMEWIK